MKMHSYMSVNGHLQQVTLQAENILRDLHEASQAPSIGGWDNALLDAKSHRAETEALTAVSASSSNDTRESTPSRTPDVPDGLTTSYTDVATATALRRRLATFSSTTNDVVVIEGNESRSPTPPDGTAAQQVDKNNWHPFDPHPLVDHPDARIADLATEYSELQSELTSLGPHYLTWPNNISLKNFAVYQLYPTLVYELEYPRTDRYVVKLVSNACGY